MREVYVRYWPVILLMALPVLAATTDELADEICSYHPTSTMCPTIDPNEPGIPPDPNEPTLPPVDPADWSWVEVSNSAMDSVYIASVDYEPFKDLMIDPWGRIQHAWSGAEVIGDKLYVHGGGHNGSPHNGVFSMDTAGHWSRVTEPSPIWRVCPDDVCTPPIGPVCPFDECTVMPDGNPVSVHTYSLLASDGRYLYRSGGSIYYRGSAGVGPKNWKFDTVTGQWSTWLESGSEGNTGSMMHVNGKLYLTGVRGSRVFDIASDTWAPDVRGFGWKKFGGQTTVIYGGGYFWALGQGKAYRTALDSFPDGWEAIPHHAVADDIGPGLVFHSGKLIAWTGGRDIHLFDPVTLIWSTVTPSGDNPGDELKNGTYDRLNVIGGEVILVSGVHNNAFRLVAGEPPVEPDPNNPIACIALPNIPEVVPDQRGEEWGHSIMVNTAIGPSIPADISSCADVKGLACEEVSPDVMDGFPQAVDSLPDSGGVVVVLPGVHVVTVSSNHRRTFDVLHIQGVPDDCGTRPIIRSALTYAIKDENGRWASPKTEPRQFLNFAKESRNLILENIEIQNYSAACLVIDNNSRPGAENQTVLIKNSFIHHCYSQAISMSKGPLQDRHGRLYVIDSELGYVWSGNHLLYFAGGESFYTQNSFYSSPGWHALKVVAHNVAVLDSVLSQVGLEGEPMPQVGAIYEGVRIGQGSPGSFVSCQRGVFQRNKIMTLENTAGVTRQPRKAIDGCDFQGSYYPLASGEWPNGRGPLDYPDEVTQFWSPEFWTDVNAPGLDYPEAVDNAHILPIYWMENEFMFLGEGIVRQAVTNSSTYPLTPKGDPQDVVPSDWLERSRDVFLNNTLVDYDYPVGLYKFDSRKDGIADEYRDQVLVNVGGNDGVFVDVPDWFVTSPLDIHYSLREITPEELY